MMRRDSEAWGDDWGLRRAEDADVTAIISLQQEAYRPNRAILGCEPLPLLADYRDIVASGEAWLREAEGRLAGLLVLERHPGRLHIWNLSVSPASQGRGLGNRLLAAAEDRARRLRAPIIDLVTGERLQRNVEWYSRHGYVVRGIEDLPDRRVVHLQKRL